MKHPSLIAIAALTVLCAGTASAQSAYGHDDAYGPMQEVGPTVMSRAEVKAELFAARADGRMSHAGEITTPDSVLLAMENHSRSVALAAAAQQAQLMASAPTYSAEMPDGGTPPEVLALMEASQPSGLQGGYTSTDGLSAAPASNEQLLEELMPVSSEVITESAEPVGNRPPSIVEEGVMQQPIVMLVELDENGEPLFIETMDLD